MAGAERQVYKMNEDFEKDLHTDTDPGSGQMGSAVDAQGVVDTTAEVVREERTEESPAAGTGYSYTYENYEQNHSGQDSYGSYGQSGAQYRSTGSAGGGYTNGSDGYNRYGQNGAGEDNTASGQSSAEGKGYYQYNASDHDYYKNENYSSSTGSRDGGRSGGNGGHGGKGKIALAIVLAVIFGVCAVAGVWGVRHYLGSSTAAASDSVADAAENNDSSITGEEEQQDAAAQDSESVSDAAQDNESASDAAQEANNVTTTTTTDDDALSEADAEAAANEAGLIISNSETADTEITRVVEKVMPSIVSVYNNYTEEVQSFYGQTYTQEGESTGSGIIIGKTEDELLIVTNNHVVEDADELSVQFIDEESAEAEIKGTDSSNDLAVIAVQLDSMKDSTLNSISVATLGNSDNIKIGEDAIAIGNALGYGQSVTTGIVSAVNREISDDEIAGTFIQTDAAINPGNSGGALVNINGEVIGINSSKIGGDTVEGMGFAIPISRAIPIIEELMTQETKTKVDEADQGTIGISGVSVTSSVASAYNMPEGVYVAEILEGGGAANSDLQQGDIITAINGTTISSMEDLKKQLQYYEAGTTVTLTIERADGNGSYTEQSIAVTLGTQESIQSTASSDENESSGSRNGNGSGRQIPGSNYGDQQESEQSSGTGSFPFGF